MAEKSKVILEIEYLLSKFTRDIENWTDDWRLSHMSEEINKDYIRGVLLGFTSAYHTQMMDLLLQTSYKELQDAFGVSPSRRQKEKYSYKETWIADDWTVALNKVYGIQIEKGKEYITIHKPWLLVKINDLCYPVFSDDPGQQDYMRIKSGKTYSFGSYNSDTIGTAIYYIICDIYEQAVARVYDYQK